MYRDYIKGSKPTSGKRQTKEQAEREKRRKARQAANEEKAEWIVANMADEIEKLRKRGRDEQES